MGIIFYQVCLICIFHILGHVGDNCVDVCSVEGVCGAHGQCVRTTNITRGYDCLCLEGWTGDNCERKVVTKICPKVKFIKKYY